MVCILIENCSIFCVPLKKESITIDDGEEINCAGNGSNAIHVVVSGRLACGSEHCFILLPQSEEKA